MRKLDNWLEGFLKYMNRCDAPKTFKYWAGLWMITVALNRKAWLKFGHFTTYPNLFIVFVGQPATFKSTICDIAKELTIGLEGIVIGPDVSSIEAITDVLGKTNNSFIYKGEELWHKSMAIVAPEWGTLIGDKDTQKCRILSRLYDCANHFNKWTKTQGDDLITNYFFTMLGATTRSEIDMCLPMSAIGQGLGRRLIFVVEDPTDDLKPPKQYELDGVLGNLLMDDLFDMSNKIIGDFRISDEADKWYDEWYEWHKTNKIISDSNFDSYYNGKVNHMIYQVAMLISISRNNEMVIEQCDMKDAAKAFSIIEERMPEALGGIGNSRSTKVIEAMKRVFRLAKKKELSLRYIGAKIWKEAGDRELTEALKTIKVYSLGTVRRGDDGEIYISFKE